jgi:hypothetical protein
MNADKFGPQVVVEFPKAFKLFAKIRAIRGQRKHVGISLNQKPAILTPSGLVGAPEPLSP